MKPRNYRSSFLLLFIIIFTVLVFWAASNGTVPRDKLFFADALYLPLIMRDLFEQGGSLWDWYQTPAPYWFPDYLLFFPTLLLAKTNYLRVVMMVVLQVAASVCAVSYLARVMNCKQPLVAGVFVGALLVIAGLGGTWPFVLVFVSAHHYGVILTSVVIVSLLISCITAVKADRPIVMPLACAFLVTGLGVASDRLLIAQGVLPLSAAVGVILLSSRKSLRAREAKVALGFVGGCLLAAALGKELAWHFRRNHPGVEPSLALSQLSESITIAGSTLGSIAEADPSAVVLAGLGFLVCFIVGGNSFRRRHIHTHYDQPDALVAMTAIFAVFIPLLIFILTATPVTITRYYGSVMLMPLICGGVLFFRGLNQFSGLRWLSAVAVIATLVTICIQVAPWARPVQFSYKPDTVDCIEREVNARQLTSGIGEYWDSGLITAMTDHRIQIAHFRAGPDFSPYRWIATERSFKKTYDFAVMNDDPKYRLMLPRHIPAPSEVIRCGGVELHIFGRNGLVVDAI